MKFDKRKFLNKCAELYPSFVETVKSVAPTCGCILRGEAFCFCVLCELYDIDVIIESGLHLGTSTEMFGKYFSDIPIHTIDLTVFPETRKKLEQFPNINMLQGDGMVLVPELVNFFHDTKIAVFIDGPKNRQQLELAKSVIDKVEFVALHDVGEDFATWEMHYLNLNYDTYSGFRSWDKSEFITTEDWYADIYSHMNESQLLWLRGEPNTDWPTRNDGYNASIHNPILEKLTPKGFGLGVAFK